MSSVSWGELKQAIKEVIKEEKAKEDEPLPNEGDITKNHACACPDCYCGIIDRMNKTSDYKCGNCGLPLGNEAFVKKIEKCPNCGHVEPEKIER